jgi:hypothetical protein
MRISPPFPTFPHLPTTSGEALNPIPHPTLYRGGGWGGVRILKLAGQNPAPTKTPLGA